jgi:F-type H+-transporting ATPase subunit b
MPQLVFADYAPQVVWLAITFGVLYLILSRLALPGIARTLGDRDARLTGDIEAAERLRAEAESALGAYQKIIAEARQKAQAELKQASVTLAAEAAKRESAFTTEANARTKAAEMAIASAKTAALADIRNMAGEAARQLVTRLAGAEPVAVEVTSALAAAERDSR